MSRVPSTELQGSAFDVGTFQDTIASLASSLDADEGEELKADIREWRDAGTRLLERP